MVQWLGLHTSNAGGPGSIPGRATKILQTVCHSQIKKKKKKEILNVFLNLFFTEV